MVNVSCICFGVEGVKMSGWEGLGVVDAGRHHTCSGRLLFLLIFYLLIP